MPTFKVRDGIHDRIAIFLNRCQGMLDLYMRNQFPTLPTETLVFAGGTKYIKIQKEGVGGSVDRPEKRWSAYCFIDVTTGDILKPETWRKPAKHARGNVFADDFGLSCMGPYGPNYMGEKPYCKDFCDELERKEREQKEASSLG